MPVFGAMCHVSSWMKYREHLASGWSSDVNRLVREESKRARHRRAQRGHWLKELFLL